MMIFRWIVGVLISTSLFTACQSSSTETTATLPAPTSLSGYQLSQTYCGSCHLRPDPSLLDKATWQQGVLPQMALRMGQSDQRMQALMNIGNVDEMTRLIEANVFPETPTMHPSDWQKLVTYYTTAAPEKLPDQPRHVAVAPTLPLFTPYQSAQSIAADVTLLTYDSVQHQLWAGNQRGRLYTLDQHLHPADSMQLRSAPTSLLPQPDGNPDLLTVGVLNPNDQRAGAWNRIVPKTGTPTVLIQGLQRPVQATTADLNRDGRTDVVICQFGHYLGRLTWHEQLTSGYREHVLDPVPGARVALVRDVDNDGWPDVVALLTQGDEQVAVYYNQRNGQFRKETVLRFPPVYGSSYLELADIDHDGDPDLIYANGDNADFSRVLKPYHGIRIFRNDGRFRFRQAWFYPMHGATQTVVRDFDQDGDLDMAAIAQFPDFGQQPQQSFVYFENQGQLRFAPHTFPQANRGRWLLIEAGDVDQDGDDDILLGAFFRPPSAEYADLMAQWRKPGAGVLLLRNQKKSAATGTRLP